jgi:hypothetical protein
MTLSRFCFVLTAPVRQLGRYKRDFFKFSTQVSVISTDVKRNVILSGSEAGGLSPASEISAVQLETNPSRS